MFDPITRLKKRLGEGQILIGSGIYFTDPQASEALADSFDFLWYDMEHSGMSLEALRNHLMVARTKNKPTIVRVTASGTPFIKPVLDAGGSGIVVPQVRTANELATAVRWTKYPPEGKRGIGAERATRWGMGIDQCVPRANKNSMVVSMMETVEAGEAIEELMNVPGVDAFFFGGHDYSASAGFTGTASEPPVVEKLDSIQRTIRERRMPSGIVTFDTKQIPQRLDQGFRMIGIGFDTTLLIRALSDALADAGRPVQESMWW